MNRHEHAKALDVPLGSAVPAGETCGHDHMTFNTDPLQNNAIRRPPPPLNQPWYDALGLLPTSNLSRRDDVAGGGMGIECVCLIPTRGSATLNTVGLAFRTTSDRPQAARRLSGSCTWVSLRTASTRASTARPPTLRRRSSRTGTRPVPCTRYAYSRVPYNRKLSAMYQTTFQVSLGIVELQVQEPESASRAPSRRPR